MARPRERRTGLPECVYQKHGAFYFVKNKKWIRLGKTEAEMYLALARLKDETTEAGMKKLFDRYERDVLAKKKDKTRTEQEKQLVLLRKVFEDMEPGAILPKHVTQYL